MEGKRLVKVALPASLVDALDEAIGREQGYGDRATFIADAVASMLAELDVGDGSPTVDDPRAASAIERTFTPAATFTIALQAPAPDVPTVAGPPEPEPEPTWGMHNRDWPTLWAASELGRVSLRGPVEFDAWARDLVETAWEIGTMKSAELDLSGFPSNQEKRDSSGGRFRTFFVGDKAGSGPLFSLGIAALAEAEGTVLLTPSGADLLRQLAGLEPRARSRMRPDWRSVYLSHLAAWVPADFAFMSAVVRNISDGHATRVGLGQAIERDYGGWSEKFLATNVAGFVARAREWNLLEPKQEGGRYLMVADALGALDEAARSADEQRAHYR